MIELYKLYLELVNAMPVTNVKDEENPEVIGYLVSQEFIERFELMMIKKGLVDDVVH